MNSGGLESECFIYHSKVCMGVLKSQKSLLFNTRGLSALRALQVMWQEGEVEV